MDSRPVFVGRYEELRRAELLLGDLRAGASSSLVVVGHAGGGKTRLLHEVADRAAERDVLTAWTTCLPFSTPLPFDPLLDLLSQLERLGAKATAPARGREGEEIFSALREAVESVADQHPVLLVVDDLQWSDSSTRDMIHFCMARLADLRVGWLLATRPESAVRRFVRRLIRGGVADRLLLSGFSLGETRDLVAAHGASEELLEELARTVHARTRGDPFLSVELLRSIRAAEGGTPVADLVPATVTEMVEERMEPLDESERDVLAWAALLPEPVAPARLAELTAADRSAGSARRLVDLGFISLDRDGWRFSHALVRDAVYATIDELDRPRRHGRVADLLEDAPAQRAPHLAAAGRHAEAAAAYVDLGYEAWLRGGPDDAAALYRRASRLADDAGDATLRLEAGVGEVLSLLRTGAPEARSRGDRLRAALRAEASDEDRLAHLCRYAVALWDEASDLDSALEVLDEARDLMDVVGGEVRAEAEWARAYVLDRAGRPAEARPFAERALETARRAGNRYLEVRALNCLGLAVGQTSGAEKGIATLEQALALAREEDLPKEAGLACLNLSYLHQVGGDEDRAETYAREGVAIQHVPPAVEAMLRGNVALGPMNRGELSTALTQLLEARSVAARAGRQTEERIMVQLCYVQIMLGELEEAERLIEQVSFPPGSWEFYRLLEPRGMLLEQGDRLPEALSVYLRADEAGDHPVSMWCLLGAIRVAAALGDLEVAEQSLREVEARAERWSAPAWLLRAGRGYVAEARGDRSAASALFAEAAAACPEAFARIHLDLRAGFAGEDRASIMDAIDAYDAIGAARAADRARSEARSIGMRPGRRRRPSGLLSDREREIVDHLASGKTNAEIAAHLFLSPRTVERHVSNVLRKLGHRSRVELAAEVSASRPRD